MRPKVVLDTNVFVGGGFNRHSASAKILDAVERGELRMMWNDATRREIETILHKIPPLRSRPVSKFFRAADHFTAQTAPEQFGRIRDPDDRKFAALGKAANAVIVSSDEHLLGHNGQGGFQLQTPGAFWRAYQKAGDTPGTTS